MNKENIAYIRDDNRKYVNKKEKVYIKMRQLFNKISVETINEGVIITVPKKYVFKDIIHILEKYEIKNILVEQELEHIEKRLLNFINENKIKKYSGKLLMKYKLLDILRYITVKKSIELLMYNIYICVNDYNKDNLELIEELARYCKCVNIITNQISKYKKLENEMYNKNLLITVSNNRRKSAKNAEILVNLDFSKEQLEKYNINMNSIIINLTNEQNFFENIFNGIIINNIIVKIPDDYNYFIKEFYGNIDLNKFLENDILRGNMKNNFMQIIEIAHLIGIRGIIQKFV